jgi:NADH-quinone oxidoreductase subunit F
MSEYDLELLRTALVPFAGNGRSALLPALQAAQSIYGHLPEPIAGEVGRALGVPLADVYGVIDFYAMFRRQPAGKQTIYVCGDPACALAGGNQVLQGLCRCLDVEPGGTSSDGAWTVMRAPCLGLCEHAPAALVDEQAFARVDPAEPGRLLELSGRPAGSLVGGDLRLLTANCGRGGPTSLEDYRAGGGYYALQKALSGMTPAEVIAEVKTSGLVGRGGAAFPTGVKWEGAAHAADQPKYVVCNADESEPGTFKDRVLMEDDPHRLLEGMAIAAYAVGAHQGYLYIRAEYPRAAGILQNAIDEAVAAGCLGQRLLGSRFDFSVEIRRGAGAYICGEETALFESIEGKRGFPRIKPPFPTTSGLFGKPTAINNVETLCNVPLILLAGAAGYRCYGTEKSPGPKLFCLSGDVARPGLYEVPFGVTLQHVLVDLAGGVTGGRLQAILFGGAAGAFATEKDLHVCMTFEDLHAAGLPLGSGVVMVFNEHRDLRQVLAGVARFFADESCGKCYPCQIGTRRQYEILSRLAGDHALPGDAERLADVGWTMTDASLCGLGQTAASAVLSALKLWPELFTG